MEDEKKKKKNKKKKNKNTKPTETISTSAEESTSLNHNHVNGSEQNNQTILPETTDVEAKGVQNAVVISGRDCINGANGSLSDDEKRYWLDREVTLEGKIKQLQIELDAHIHREADLESDILQIRTERNSCIQEQADLETKYLQLQNEKGFWIQKEASYEKRINELVEEAASSSSARASLEEQIELLEKDKTSRLQMESKTEEIISSLNDDIARLRAQVSELEASRNDLFRQNQQLTENISGLQKQVQNLEIAASQISTENTMHTFENGQMEAARALVEKLLSENAQLVEKVNELYVELDRLGANVGPHESVHSDHVDGSSETVGVTERSVNGTDAVVGSAETARIVESEAHETDAKPATGEGPASAAENSATGTDPMAVTAERTDSVRVPGPMFEIIKKTLSVERLDSLEDDVIKTSNGGSDINDADPEVNPYSRESTESSEIVQIPLDENEVRVTEFEAPQTDENTNVPLTDAPLIGAPFRLISYFARYVSGADLVNQNSINGRR